MRALDSGRSHQAERAGVPRCHGGQRLPAERVGSLTSESGKRTTNRTVTNFQDLFTVTGFDIKNLLVDALIGEQVDEKAYADPVESELERILDAWSRMPHGLSGTTSTSS